MSDLQRYRKGKEVKRKFEYSNSDIDHYIDEYIHSERDRRILKRKLIDGITHEALAEEFDLSVTTVKTIVRKGIETLLKYIERPS